MWRWVRASQSYRSIDRGVTMVDTGILVDCHCLPRQMTPSGNFPTLRPNIRSVPCLLALCLVAALMAGCATTFDVGQAAVDVTPQQAAHDIAAVQGKQVAWGGVIVATKNLAEKTQIEVLSYPLDGRNRPEVGAKPSGRFLAFHPGFLDPVNFSAGRLVTVVGQIDGTVSGAVGEARYLYPAIETSRVFLWPTLDQEAAQPQFHFGVGIGITR
jgi:outer membrane lipoprotein